MLLGRKVSAQTYGVVFYTAHYNVSKPKFMVRTINATFPMQIVGSETTYANVEDFANVLEIATNASDFHLVSVEQYKRGKWVDVTADYIKEL